MDAYAEAARQRGLMPRQMQSITWEAVRTLYSADDRKSKKVLAKAKITGKLTEMKKSRQEFSEKESLLRSGLDPEMVENLEQSQQSLARLGIKRTLQEVYDLEVEQTAE